MWPHFLAFWQFCGYTGDMMAGRPKKADSDRRENILRIRLTESERAHLDETARIKSLDTSTWARMQLLRLVDKEDQHVDKPTQGDIK